MKTINRSSLRTRRFAPAFARSGRPVASVAILAACGALFHSTAVQAQPAGSTLPPGAVPVLSRIVTPNTSLGATVPLPGGGNRLTIQQNERRAIIEWQKFNIGGASEVRFNQPDVGSVALNRVLDPSGDPSIIQGRLSANGQIILMNRNGVLFDRGAQINVFGLTAAAMNGPSNTQGFYDRFLTTGLLLPSNSADWSFEGALPLANGSLPAIEVGRYGDAQATARLEATVGGSIMLFAPRVVNHPGSIVKAPDGQVILAAGSRVRLSENIEGNGQASVSMRGLLVEIAADSGSINLTSLVHNLGLITAERGNVTLAGLAVNHQGTIETTTAVTQNGSIWLRGRKETTLGPGSVTRTPLDVANTTRLAEGDDFTPYKPQVRVEGQTINIQGEITSPSGVVTATARPELTDPSGPTRVFVDSGARISVAGSWADVPVSYNFLTQRITSNELKDAPLQKGGILFGQTVTVDVRRGPRFPLFDFTQQFRNEPRSIVEKATSGGSVTFDSSGDVIVRAGSVTDVSGGGFRFSAADISSTKLYANGVQYAIEVAPANLNYELISTAGQTDTWRTPDGRFGISVPIGAPGAVVVEPASIEGRSAGTISVLAGGGQSGVVLDGEIRGGVTIGPGQRSADRRPAGGTLILGGAIDPTAVVVDYRLRNVRWENAPTPLSIAFQDVLPASRSERLTLDSGLFGTATLGSFGEYVRSGISNLQLFANDRIDVPAGVTLMAPPGASVALSGAQLVIDGTVSAPGGNILINTNAQTAGNTGRRSVVLGATGILDASGLWINDSESVRQSGVVAAVPLNRDGGTVTIAAGSAPAGTLNDVSLQPGSLIDVGGGGSVSTAQRVTGGNGGRINVTVSSPNQGETLSLGGTLTGIAAGNGATLNLTAPSVRIGGTPTPVGAEMVLDSAFFDGGGFANYLVNGLNGLRVIAGTDLSPTAQSLAFAPDAIFRPTGSEVSALSSVVLRPEGQRRPASLTLSATRADQAGVVIEAGARVRVDPLASVAVTSTASITVDGEIDAPAGSISLSLQRAGDAVPSRISLGPNARLTSRGHFQQTPNARGLVQGTVLQGGQVTIQASTGALQASPTAVVDVGAVSATVDSDDTVAFATLVPGAVPVAVRTTLQGNAGSVLIRATDSSTLPTFLGQGAGPATAGGNFELEFFARGDTTLGAVEREHRLTVGTQASGVPNVASIVVDPQTLRDHGFDRVRLSSLDVIEFAGGPTLAANRGLTLVARQFASDAGTTRLSGAVVSLRNDEATGLRPQTPVATFGGAGRLEVGAGLIDLTGNLTFNGFGNVSLVSAGDLRLTGRGVASGTSTMPSAFTGSLITSADIALTAQQIYPTTRSDFTVAVRDVTTVTDVVTGQVSLASSETVPGSRIAIARSAGTPGTVFSAGGSITFDADTIRSDGTVRAPLGTLNFGRVRSDGTLAASSVVLADGSISSTKVDPAFVLYGGTVNGRLDWLYGGSTISRPPTRSVALRADGVVLASGALVDLSGGGEILGVEFQPGIGGSIDVLLNSNLFVVLPNANLSFGPLDIHQSGVRNLGFGTGRSVYDSVYLSGIDGLPAGNYPLLPGYYALLPGAFIVTPLTGTAFADFRPGRDSTLADGSTVVSGYRTAAGTSVREAQSSAFAVRPGTSVQREAEYLTSTSDFFVQRALVGDLPRPRLPEDAGRLELLAQTNLIVEGAILATRSRPGARGATVDIAARNIAVVDAVGQAGIPAQFLQLEAGPLSAFDASVLIGGTRDDDGTQTQLTTRADEILVANSVAQPLQGPEIVLAARNRVTLEPGSVVAGTGAPGAA
ncbi:MAG: filamentous hemagglutinin N-terminal domain-containing protein, partial [Proteobacteria bacterium]|nr:filamentous hemagglutinin N-terminal domain-containing protein [Burkholderiales bacterium]